MTVDNGLKDEPGFPGSSCLWAGTSICEQTLQLRSYASTLRLRLGLNLRSIERRGASYNGR